MSDFKHLSMNQNDRGVVTVAFAHATKPINVFDVELIRELQLVVADLEAKQNATCVVFRSRKESGFFAGADVSAICTLPTPREAERVLGEGQELFGRIAALSVPSVAVIHGPCVGGGLELALSCTYRIARDDVDTRLGLPETQLGLIPAWGGTQRLPMIVGTSTAIRMILEATQVSSRKAKSIGLVDEIAPVNGFDESVEKYVVSKIDDRRVVRRSKRWLDWAISRFPPVRWLYLQAVRRRVAPMNRHYPALVAALNAIDIGLSSGPKAGFERERQEFSKLLFTSTARNLLDLFVRREQARQPGTWLGQEPSLSGNLETIAVFGGGTMGAGIAQLAASKGYRVIVKELNEELAEAGLMRIDAMLAHAVEKQVMSTGESEQIRSRISATAKLEDVKCADLVIEAIVERLDVKQQLFYELDQVLPEHAIFTSNTSALPISRLAAVTRRAAQTAGLHFFNPVQKMPLVEIVRTDSTSEQALAKLLQLARRLGKTPLVVREGPGFLVNRVLFPYMEEAMRLVLEGVPTPEVDRAAKQFGMPMGPLELLDAVGLDVALDVAHSLNTGQTEGNSTHDLLTLMVRQGLKGQKSGTGFYRYPSGKRSRPTRVLEEGYRQRRCMPESVNLGGEILDGVGQRLVFSMINSAAGALYDRIVPEAWMVDLGMVLGTGFAPFRGGPMRLVSDWGLEHVVRTLETLAAVCGPRFQPNNWFLSALPAVTTEVPSASQLIQ